MKKIHPSTSRNALAVRWVPVVADDGRVRVEMRWSTVPAVPRRPA